MVSVVSILFQKDNVTCTTTIVITTTTTKTPGTTWLRRLVAGFPPRWPGFLLRSWYMKFVVDKVALGQIFSEYLGFPCQFLFHLLLHTHHLSSWADARGQLLADVPSRLSLTSPQKIKKVLLLQLQQLPLLLLLLRRLIIIIIIIIPNIFGVVNNEILNWLEFDQITTYV
jgi:hypothetical protein